MSKQTPILLIWEMVPESTDVYLIDDPPDWLPQCDDCHLGAELPADIEALMLRVCDALAEDPKHLGNPDDELACKWAALKVDKSSTINGPIRIVKCGFLL